MRLGGTARLGRGDPAYPQTLGIAQGENADPAAAVETFRRLGRYAEQVLARATAFAPRGSRAHVELGERPLVRDRPTGVLPHCNAARAIDPPNLAISSRLDGGGFVRAVEAARRQMWRTWGSR